MNENLGPASPPRAAETTPAASSAARAVEARAMLELVRDQQISAELAQGSFVSWILGVWGVAYLFGFSALWLIDGPDTAAQLNPTVASVIYAVLLIAAFVTSIILGIRASAGERGRSAFLSTVYGMCWPLGTIALVAVGLGLGAHGASGELLAFYFPCAISIFVGVMYVIAGGIWYSRIPIAFGVWMVAISVLAVALPYPMHYLVFAFAGGGVFLVLAVVNIVQMRRARRRAAREM